MPIQLTGNRRRAALLAAATCCLLITTGTTVAAVGPEPGPADVNRTWSVDLGTLTDDDAGVRHTGGALRLDPGAPVGGAEPGASAGTGAASPGTREVSGQLVAEPVGLSSPAAAIAADVDADAPAGTSVLVDVRGRLSGQGPDSWTEWVPAGSPLPSVSETVQARVTLVSAGDATPAVRKVSLTPKADRSRSLQDVETGEAEAGQSGAKAYTVFATREGLVGGTTANGHVITQRDHFVALPSRRGLSSKGSGSYSVRVCAPSTGRCAYAPVWDVGPWNTTDDYWNPTESRQSWGDLPRGKPQAQAAYQDGYNNGRDGFDRKVVNPAGIDLGDGTFWDGLGLKDNAWTTVTYLWSGSGPRGIVRTDGGPLNVRSGPGTDYAAVGMAGRYANLVIECTATGTTVNGSLGTTKVWNRIGPGNWVSDAYVDTGADGRAPAC